jgi:hypothetical protein
MQILPRAIPGSKTTLSDNLTTSFLIDRNMTMELGKNVLIILSTEEVAALYDYLQRHAAKFKQVGEQK